MLTELKAAPFAVGDQVRYVGGPTWATGAGAYLMTGMVGTVIESDAEWLDPITGEKNEAEFRIKFVGWDLPMRASKAEGRFRKV